MTRKTFVTVERRRTEAEATLKGFIAVASNKYGTDSYALGFLSKMLEMVMCEELSEAEFKSRMEILRNASVKLFVE